MEQRDILRHDGDRGAQALLRNARDILSVEQHTAAFHIMEPLQQRKQTGLPGAGGPDQSDALTRFEMQIEVLEQLVTVAMAERDVLERYARAGLDQRDRLRMLAHLMWHEQRFERLGEPRQMLNHI